MGHSRTISLGPHRWPAEVRRPNGETYTVTLVDTRFDGELFVAVDENGVEYVKHESGFGLVERG